MKPARLIGILLFSALFACFLSIINSGCVPDGSVVNGDTIPDPPTPPTPPPPDTTSYVKKIEESYIQGNPSITHSSRIFSFYYDGQKRLSAVGIRFFYSAAVSDSFTTRFFYSGANSKPYLIIRPFPLFNQPGAPAYYDTCWISYGTNGLPVKDSSRDLVYNVNTNLPEYKPLVRNYSYPDNNTYYTSWYGSTNNTNTLLLLRNDTALWLANHTAQMITSKFVNQIHDRAKAHSFTFTGYVNPLAKLNISGTIYSLLYSPAWKEILGNSFHPAVWNSNGLAYYLDFCNAYLPSDFYIGAYSAAGDLQGSGSIHFTTQITPWAVRGEYPGVIAVNVSGSLGEVFQYRFEYY